MPAPKGNRFWELRTKHGRNKLFATSEILWVECLKYFDWCEEHPLQEEKAFHNAGTITKTTVSHIRAMTLQGLWFYLRISKDTWYSYRKNKDFAAVIQEAEQTIYNQKFAGAAADLLNANIIARDLGLVDKKEQKVEVEFENLSGDQLDSRIKNLEKKLNG